VAPVLYDQKIVPFGGVGVDFNCGKSYDTRPGRSNGEDAGLPGEAVGHIVADAM
jgi:hypothetical protein